MSRAPAPTSPTSRATSASGPTRRSSPGSRASCSGTANIIASDAVKIGDKRLGALVAGALFCVAAPALAEEPQDRDAKLQATYVWQQKRPFEAAYSGPHSLSPDREKS